VIAAEAQSTPATVPEPPQILFGAEVADGDALRSRLLPLVLDASQPYARCFYEDDRKAAIAFSALMQERESELSLDKIAILYDTSEPCGMYIAMSGLELAHSRRRQLVAALRLVGPSGVTALKCRIKALDSLFPPVAETDFYLSKLAIASSKRRRGFGAALMSHYLGRGLRQGFRRFRLDVHAGNGMAIRLYERLGFRVACRNRAELCDLQYLSMVLSL
jgi:ribosomal protein S18 acetylase RimI-like enzyme